MAIYFEGLVTYCLMILFVILALILKFKLKKTYTYLLFFTIMYIYLCNVIDITQFPIYKDDDQREIFGGQNVFRTMNLIPFQYGFTKDSFLNILMTVPLGLGLPFLIKASFKKIFGAGLLMGLSIECTQLLVALYAGYTLRYVDIDDIIYNLLGTLMGYLILFKLFKITLKFIVKKFDMKFNPLLKHMYNA